MSEPRVSVVIPSYNRGHLLPKVIPSYLQEDVKEVIIVDDHSSDDTALVVAEMMKSEPRIRYIRKDRNEKQAAAKNDGIDKVTGDLIYFGDDDSFIIPATISKLLSTMNELDADIVGAKVIYMEEEEAGLDWQKIVADRDKLGAQIIDINRFKVNFTTSVERPTEMKLCHACFLIKTTLAKRIKFDPHSFQGNGYREETDFLVRAVGEGAKLIYRSDAVQINLPRSSTYASVKWKNLFKPELITLSNNLRFLNKNHEILVRVHGVSWPVWRMQLSFIWQRIPYLIMALLQTISPSLIRLRLWLKSLRNR